MIDKSHNSILDHWLMKSIVFACMCWFVSVIASAVVLASPTFPQPPTQTEVEWSAELATRINGEAEHRLPDGSRVDILTDTHAIEVEWSDKWPEAIGQAAYYAMATDREPCVWLLLRGRFDEDYLRCLMVCRKYGIKLQTIKTD